MTDYEFRLEYAFGQWLPIPWVTADEAKFIAWLEDRMEELFKEASEKMAESIKNDPNIWH